MMKLFGVRQSVFVGIFLFSLAAVAFAQDYRGKLQGAITDESGGVVPGAKVVLQNDATKVEVTTTTNDEGRYRFDFVEPGNYTVIVEKDGFKKIIQQKLVVQIQGDLTVDLKLSVGDTPVRLSARSVAARLRM